MIDQRAIRNFAIIAHIDHGKSTLADRIIELCGGLSKREMHAQVLDSMILERERGITIKAQTVRLIYRRGDQTYYLNLIDTPGHVDFSYEVSRSLAACEGSLLVVDASQGVEAQTLANTYHAIENDHDIVPVLNKIDLPSADPESTCAQIEAVLGIDCSEALLISAKTGQGIASVLDAIVDRLPAPQGNETAPLKALLVDSWYDPYLGVVVLVRVVDGQLRAGLRIRLLATKAVYKIDRVGIFCPKPETTDVLGPGSIGFMTASIRRLEDMKIGDTITREDEGVSEPLAGFRQIQPVVFCGFFPHEHGEFSALGEAVAKLSLNDSSFHYEKESSTALGFGFRCGFLGLLHLEIIRERIEREFNIPIITTAPGVVYHVHRRDGTVEILHNPAALPDPTYIEHIDEPWVRATLFIPDIHLGVVLKLCEERRGKQIELTHTGNRVYLVYRLPLNEIVYDFHDRLKSVSRGYASFDYELDGYDPAPLKRMTFLINGDPVDALAMIVHQERALLRGRTMCEKLRELIPRHLFKIPIQAVLGGRVIARETIAALRKDVTAKCYGGDVTRKRKLLDRQKAGKKKMRRFGKVDIPHDVFIRALESNDDH